MSLIATSPSRKSKQVAVFYITALLLALILALSPIGEMVLLFTMFTPLAAVLVTRIVLPDDDGHRMVWRDLGLTSLGLKLWPLALLLPIVVLLPGYLVLWGTGLADMSRPSLPGSALSAAAKLVIGFLLGCIWAMSEEIGWRGFLLPRLASLIGPMRGSLVTGFLHGLWHMPVLMLTTFYHGEGAMIVVVPLFLIAVTLVGPIFGYLRLSTGSIIPVVLLHGSWNNVWEFQSGLTTTQYPQITDYLAGESGVLTVVLILCVNVGLWRRFGDNPAGGIRAQQQLQSHVATRSDFLRY